MRLFIALWPQPDVCAAIAAVSQAIAWPASTRPTAQDKLHLTLHFLGEVDECRVPALRAALAVPAPAFELRLDQLQTWLGGLLVLCPSAVPPALTQWHAALAQRLSAQGLPLEARAFRPHVTLARRAWGRCLPRCWQPVHWPVRGHALMASTPECGYSVLQAWHDPGCSA